VFAQPIEQRLGRLPGMRGSAGQDESRRHAATLECIGQQCDLMRAVYREAARILTLHAMSNQDDIQLNGSCGRKR